VFQFSARANVSPVVAAMTMRQGACALELVDAVAAISTCVLGLGDWGMMMMMKRSIPDWGFFSLY